MNPTTGLYALGTCLLAATMAVSPAAPSWFEAHTTGTKELTLRGTAEYGAVVNDDGTGVFVVTLGAESPTGAVVFTRWSDTRIEPGVYQLGDSADAIQALVVTGPPTRPTGAFRARSGRLTITPSLGDVVAGHFEIDARGYEAADPADEDRPLSVRGMFTASPSR